MKCPSVYCENVGGNNNNSVCFVYGKVSPSFQGDSKERLNGRLRVRKRERERYQIEIEREGWDLKAQIGSECVISIANVQYKTLVLVIVSYTTFHPEYIHYNIAFTNMLSKQSNLSDKFKRKSTFLRLFHDNLLLRQFVIL